MIKRLRRIFLSAFLFLPLILAFGCTGEQKKAKKRQPPEIVAPTSHSELRAFFTARDYAWDSVAEGVPPFILETLPRDLSRISRISEKKEIFFLSLLPMVLLANEEIGSQRKLFELLRADSLAGKAISEEDRQWVLDLAAEYGVEEDPLVNARAGVLLLQRLDIIPPSLVLAQAATESGFGTSYIALNRNNLFGEFTYAAAEGAEGRKTYRLRHFPTLYDSVQSYMKNLNTHPAYILFRLRRADQRREGRPLVGSDLAVGLTAYSERGEAYIRDVQQVLRQNRLSLLASVNLRADIPAPAKGAGSPSFRPTEPATTP